MTASGREHRLPCAAGAPGVALLCTSLPTSGAFIAPPQARAPGAAPKAGQPWYTIHAEANGAAEIEIYGIIGEAYDWWTGEKTGVSAQTFIEDLKALKAGTALNIRINSPGGDVFDGSTIYNRLVQWDGEVTVTIDGLAASAASVIAMAGKVIRMPPTAMLMIHNPWTFAYGEAGDFRKAAETLDTIREAMMAAYRAANPTMSEEDLVAALDAETWYTADAAADAGFPVEQIEASGPSAQAMIYRASLTRFSNVPTALMEAAIDEEAPTEEIETVVDTTVAETSTDPTDPPAEEVLQPAAPEDAQEQIAALTATVEALTQQLSAPAPAPETEAPKAKVDANSPVVKALRGVAALSGREADFDDAVVAGRTLSELQARFASGQGQAKVKTSALVPDPATVKPQGSTTKPKSAAEIYAIRRQQQQNRN